MWLEKKDMDRYYCIVNFLFAEFFGGPWKKACLSYYDGEGEKLKYILSEETRHKMELILFNAVLYGYKVFCREREKSWYGKRISWCSFRYQVYKRLTA